MTKWQNDVEKWSRKDVQILYIFASSSGMVRFTTRLVRSKSVSSTTPIIGAFKHHILQRHFCFFFLLVLYLLGDYRRVRFHDNKSSTECWFNCSIVTVISLIIERLRKFWWRDKRYVKFYFLRKLSRTVRRVTWRGCFFVWWRLIVKPITYSDSAKLRKSFHTKHLD